MDVYWLEQNVADLPARNEWLSDGERAQLESMRFERRRADWRLGRWTAKHAVAIYLGRPVEFCNLAELEIRPSLSGAPEVFIANRPAGASISLSHRAGTAMCAVAAPGAALGCDLEIAEPHSDGFVSDYFAAKEQELVKASAGQRDWLVALIWSSKESVLKLLRKGLRLDTRLLVVDPCIDLLVQNEKSHGTNSWHPLSICYDGCTFSGWWQNFNAVIRTLVSAPPSARPIFMRSDVDSGSNQRQRCISIAVLE